MEFPQSAEGRVEWTVRRIEADIRGPTALRSGGGRLELRRWTYDYTQTSLC